MSIFDQYKQSKQLWIVTALVLALALCIGIAAFLTLRTKPAGPAPASSSPSLVVEESSDPSESSEEASSEESELESSEEESSGSSSLASSSASTGGWKPSSSSASSTVIDITPPVEQTLTVSTPGVHSETATLSSVTVAVSGVTLQNKTITGDLTIAAGVDAGSVVLENSAVKGHIIVRGGDSVTLKDVTASGVEVARSGGVTRLLIKGRTTVQELVARSHVVVDETGLENGYDGLRAAVTQSGAPVWQSIELGTAALDSISTNETSNITVGGGSSVGTLTANAATHIAGTGTVSRLVAAHSDVTYVHRPLSVDVKTGVSSPTQRSWAIGENDPSSGGGGGGGGGSERERLGRPSVTASAPDGLNQVAFSFDSAGGHVSRYVATYKVNGVTRAATGDRLTLLPTDRTVSVSVYAVSRYSSSYNSPTVQMTYAVKSRATPTGLTLEKADDGALRAGFAVTDGLTALGQYDVSAELADTKLTPKSPAIAGGRYTATLEPTGLTQTAQTLTLTVTSKGVGDNTGRVLWLASTPATQTLQLTRLAQPALTTANITAADSGAALVLTLPADQPPANVTYTVRSLGGTNDNVDLTPTGKVYRFTLRDGAPTMGFVVTAKAAPSLVGPLALDSLPLTLAINPAQRRALPAPGALTLEADSADKAVFGFSAVEGATGYRLVYSGLTRATATLEIAASAASGGSVRYESDVDIANVASFTVSSVGDGLLTVDSSSVPSGPVIRLQQPTGLGVDFSDLTQSKLTLHFDPRDDALRHELVITSSDRPTPVTVTLAAGQRTHTLDLSRVVSPQEMTFSFTVRALSPGGATLSSETASSNRYTVERLSNPDDIVLDSGMTATAQQYTVTVGSPRQASALSVEYQADNGSYRIAGDSGFGRQISLPLGQELTGLKVRALGSMSGDTVYLPSLTATRAVAQPVLTASAPDFDPVADSSRLTFTVPAGRVLADCILSVSVDGAPLAAHPLAGATLTGGQVQVTVAGEVTGFVFTLKPLDDGSTCWLNGRVEG